MPFNISSIFSPSITKIAEVADSAFDEPRFEFSDIIEGWHGARPQEDDPREDKGQQPKQDQAEEARQQEQKEQDDLTLEMGDKNRHFLDESMPNPDGTGPVGPAILEGVVENHFSLAALEGAGSFSLEGIHDMGPANSQISIDPTFYVF
jgi:hypothetical protein